MSKKRGFTLCKGHRWPAYPGLPMPYLQVVFGRSQTNSIYADQMRNRYLPATRDLERVWEVHLPRPTEPCDELHRWALRLLYGRCEGSKGSSKLHWAAEYCYQGQEFGVWDATEAQVALPGDRPYSPVFKAALESPMLLVAKLISYYTGEHVAEIRARLEAELVLNALEK